MVYARKFGSLMLLIVFQVFVIHQALPHIHHSHQDSHHHHHDEHHHDDHKHDHASHHHGLLGIILGDHSHSDNDGHQHAIKDAKVQNHKIKLLNGFAPEQGVKIWDFTNQNCFVEEINSPGNLSYQYLPYLNHRGPPLFI